MMRDPSLIFLKTLRKKIFFNLDFINFKHYGNETHFDGCLHYIK